MQSTINPTYSDPIQRTEYKTSCTESIKSPWQYQLTSEESLWIAQFPDIKNAVLPLARVILASVCKGARGCSPRVVNAVNRVETTVCCEFGRCLDNGAAFSTGVSKQFMDSVITKLSTCQDWNEIQNWQAIDQYFSLVKLPVLGESYITSKCTFKVECDKIHVTHVRKSIESEARFKCVVGATELSDSDVHALVKEKFQADTTSLLLQPSTNIVHATPRASTNSSLSTESTTSHSVTQSANSGATCDSRQSPLVAFGTSSAPNASKPQVRCDASMKPPLDAVKVQECVKATFALTSQHCTSSKDSVTVSKALQASRMSHPMQKQLKQMTRCNVGSALYYRTPSVASRESGPLDVRVYVQRDIPVGAKNLPDIVEPFRSDTSLTKTFLLESLGTTGVSPVWEYEVTLTWTARGITAAERSQRENSPRRVCRLRLLNPVELIAANVKTPAQLAVSMLFKVKQLQDSILNAENAMLFTQVKNNTILYHPVAIKLVNDKDMGLFTPGQVEYTQPSVRQSSLQNRFAATPVNMQYRAIEKPIPPPPSMKFEEDT